MNSPCVWQPCVFMIVLWGASCNGSSAASCPCSWQRYAGADGVSGRVVLIDLFNIFACQALEMQNAVFHSICHLSHTILRWLKMQREKSCPIVFGTETIENKITCYEYILTGGSVLKTNVKKALWGNMLVSSVRVIHCPDTNVIFKLWMQLGHFSERSSVTTTLIHHD